MSPFWLFYIVYSETMLISRIINKFYSAQDLWSIININITSLALSWTYHGNHKHKGELAHSAQMHKMQPYFQMDGRICLEWLTWRAGLNTSLLVLLMKKEMQQLVLCHTFLILRLFCTLPENTYSMRLTLFTWTPQKLLSVWVPLWWTVISML